VISGAGREKHQVCHLLRPHIENRDNVTAKEKNHDTATRAAFSEQENGSPEVDAMLPARVNGVGAKRIRFWEDPTARGADRNPKGLAEQRKRLQRTGNPEREEVSPAELQPEGEERIRSPVLQALFPVKLHPKGSDRICSLERPDDLRVNWNRYPVRWIQELVPVDRALNPPDIVSQ